MMLPLLYVSAPFCKGAHIYTISVGYLFSSFISLVFGDTTFFDEQYRVPHAF